MGQILDLINACDDTVIKKVFNLFMHACENTTNMQICLSLCNRILYNESKDASK